MQETIIVKDLEIQIIKKKIKNLHLKLIPPVGDVIISMPYKMSMTTVKNFIESKWSWIEKHRQELLQKPSLPIYQYLDGELHHVWGEHYPLKLQTDYHPTRVYIQENALYLHAPLNAGIKAKQYILEQWHHAQLQAALPNYIAKWEPQLGVSVKGFSLRKMKSCWGSCNTRTGEIMFNTELVKKPLSCLEYIVVHEMVHLLEPSHNHRFKSLMSHFLPDWQLHKKFLNQI